MSGLSLLNNWPFTMFSIGLIREIQQNGWEASDQNFGEENWAIFVQNAIP